MHRFDCTRDLTNHKRASEFLAKVLELDTSDEHVKAAARIAAIESLCAGRTGQGTLHDSDHRDPRYESEAERGKLRHRIRCEVLMLPRPDDDDTISLGRGGCLPRKGVRKERVAFLVIGPPAAGKSRIARQIADRFHAALIDSDIVKRKLPEYGDLDKAVLVHEEAAAITYPNVPKPPKAEGLEESVYGIALDAGMNVVVAQVSISAENLRADREILRERGYEVHLILAEADRRVATRRAFDRYLKSGRYVPLSFVFDTVANEPILTYYRTRHDPNWASFAAYNTERAHPVREDASANCPLLKVRIR